MNFFWNAASELTMQDENIETNLHVVFGLVATENDKSCLQVENILQYDHYIFQTFSLYPMDLNLSAHKSFFEDSLNAPSLHSVHYSIRTYDARREY